MAAVPDKSGAWSLGESVLWYNPTAGGIDSTWSLGESIILDEVYAAGHTVYADIGGVVKLVPRFYALVGGVVKEIFLYANVGGVVKPMWN